MTKRISIGLTEHKTPKTMLQINHEHDDEYQRYSGDTSPKLDTKDSAVSEIRQEQDGLIHIINGANNWILTTVNNSDISNDY